MLARRSRKSRGVLVMEKLESRQLMSVTYGTNVIVNPGAEIYKGTADGNVIITPTGWTANGDPTVDPYSGGDGVSASIPQPPNSGKAFFTGGPDMQSTDLFQTIDLSSIGTAIDAKQVKFALSAYLGGYISQGDDATLFVNFQNAAKSFVSQVSLGPVTPADRNDNTGMLLRSLNGVVPSGARFAQVQIHFERTDGSYNDGYADNLSLVLNGPTATTGSIAGTVYNDINGDGLRGSGEAGLGGVKVFLDKNNNGLPDAGEPAILTSASGAYAFSGVAPGTYSVREVVPASYRATTLNPLSVTVAAGSSLTGKDFGDSQTVLITGTVFNDANGNKKKDTGEAGLAGVVVYLDFNNNGQLDSFELKTTTDSNGNYKFVEPFGTYTVREVTPANYAPTVAPATLTLAKGAVSANNNFGNKHL